MKESDLLTSMVNWLADIPESFLESVIQILQTPMPAAPEKRPCRESCISADSTRNSRFSYISEPLTTSFPIIDDDPTKFVDPEFPPSEDSFGTVYEEDPESRLTIPLAEKESCVWVRAQDMIKSTNQEPTLFGDIQPNDILQGMIGDCWLIASMSALAEYPARVRSLFLQDTYNPEGRYEIQLFDLGQCQWVTITIDDYIPTKLTYDFSNIPHIFSDEGTPVINVADIPNVNPETGKRVIPTKYVPFFCRPKGNQLWCTLLEKAVAKFTKNYSRISGGNEEFAFILFTGFSQVYIFKRSSAISQVWRRSFAQWACRNHPTVGHVLDEDKPSKSAADLFTQLRRYYKQHFLMVTCILDLESPSAVEGPRPRPDGLVCGHAYSLIGVYRFPQVKLVKLRNPHGRAEEGRTTEWTGNWSCYSNKWERHPEIRDKLTYDPENCDGFFYMEFFEFCGIFNKVTLMPKCMRQHCSCQKGGWKKQNFEALGQLTLNLLARKTEDRTAMQKMSAVPRDPYWFPPGFLRKRQTHIDRWLTEKHTQKG